MAQRKTLLFSEGKININSWNINVQQQQHLPRNAKQEAKNTVNMQTRVKNNNNIKWFFSGNFICYSIRFFFARCHTNTHIAHSVVPSCPPAYVHTIHIFRTCATVFSLRRSTFFSLAWQSFFIPFVFIWFELVWVQLLLLLLLNCCCLVAAFTSF